MRQAAEPVPEHDAIMTPREKKMLGIIVTAFYVAGCLSALHAAMTTRTATGAVAWTVSLVTMPFIAVPAYAVFGRDKFAGLAEAFEERQDEIESGLRAFHGNLEPWAIAPGDSPSWYRAIRELVSFNIVRGNEVTLLINGDETFDSILEGIAGAREYVLFQFYMIHDDELGRRVKSALIERAREGLKIIVLYDEVGSSGLPASYVDDLTAAGIAVSAFRPTQGRGNRFQLNFRNHRKMVVVDGKSAWIGGHNVGDEYLGLDPDISPWRDTHVRIDGPAALQAQLSILADWYWATREIPVLNWTPQPAENSDQHVMIIPTAPTGHLESASLIFVAALSAARERIWLSAPYFVPDEAVMKALQLAALRGVDVRVITTGKPDSLPVYFAAFHYIRQLRGLGIDFYAYQPGFLHEKVMLIDDQASLVGTHNLDNRSLRLNFEVTSVIIDENFAAEMEAMFEDDFAQSQIIDADRWEQRPYWWRVAVQLSRLAAPVL
jgi:cardiolipin synthase